MYISRGVMTLGSEDLQVFNSLIIDRVQGLVENHWKDFKMIIVVEITLLRVEILPKPIGFLFTNTTPISNAGAMQQCDMYIVAESEQSPPSSSNPIRFKRHEDSKFVLRRKAKKGKHKPNTNIRKAVHRTSSDGAAGSAVYCWSYTA
jgi:hypothetical protein